MKIERKLKFATFTYDEEDKSVVIETRSDATSARGWIHNPIAGECCEGICNGHVETDEQYAERIAKIDPPISGRIHLNQVYSFALLRFVIRIAQRNWFRKLK
tara:strand:+ start:3144 stop:3449 length:306 start_codon:yes stop_codon:yes gene_type:complete